jgi:ketosteroid isomerase-like protein
MSTMLEVLQALQRANDRRDKAAVLALVTDDVVYHYHVGSKPLHGPDKIGKFLDNYWGRSKDPLWRVDTAAETGNKLLVEGYEEYTDTQTGQRVTNRYMGIMEFRDGKIAGWRDYFQLTVPPAATQGASTA